MDAREPKKGPKPGEDWARQVGAKEKRKQRAQQEGRKSVWFGFGMFGLVGWSVAIPSVAAIALGVWLDSHTQGGYSWTLMLLVIGVALGCLNAWFWLKRENRRD
jgi:ATP synthase protein I